MTAASPAPEPATSSFTSLGLSSASLGPLTALDITSPKPVQTEVIPLVLAGKNVIADAPPGKGKTIAFLSPTIQRVAEARRELKQGVFSIVIAKTQPLCTQLTEQANLLGKEHGVRAVALYGGIERHQRDRLLAQDPQIVVATHGCLVNHLTGEGQARIDPRHLQSVLIDEADGLLMSKHDLPTLNRIFRLLPPGCQRLLFSATFHTNNFQRKLELANEFAPGAAYVEIQEDQDQFAPNVLYNINNRAPKDELLLHILETQVRGSVIIFCQTNGTAGQVHGWLRERGRRTGLFKRDADRRHQVLQEFRDGELDILVTAGLGERGLDISKRLDVINFDFPPDFTSFTHRAGRTGRLSQEIGLVISILTPKDYERIDRNREGTRNFPVGFLAELKATTNAFPSQISHLEFQPGRSNRGTKPERRQKDRGAHRPATGGRGRRGRSGQRPKKSPKREPRRRKFDDGSDY